MTASDKMKRTMFWLTERQRAALKSVSKKTGVPMAEFVRRAIDDRLRSCKFKDV